MQESDKNLFLELERTAKGLSMGASAEASRELRAVFDALRGPREALGTNAPSLALDEVPTSKPRIVPVLLSISKSTRALTGLKLTELGFHNGQDELLLALNEEVSVSVSRLADELCVRPSTVSKMLDRLVAAGLVARINDNRDARKTMVRITPAGLDARSLLLRMRENLEVELVSSFSNGIDGVKQALETIAATLKARLSRLR